MCNINFEDPNTMQRLLVMALKRIEVLETTLEASMKRADELDARLRLIESRVRVLPSAFSSSLELEFVDHKWCHCHLIITGNLELCERL